MYRQISGWTRPPQTAEPDYVAQSAEIKPGEDGAMRDWVDARNREAREKGCTGFRLSWDDDHDLLLLEAWRIMPADQGAPRFALNVEDPLGR